MHQIELSELKTKLDASNPIAALQLSRNRITEDNARSAIMRLRNQVRTESDPLLRHETQETLDLLERLEWRLLSPLDAHLLVNSYRNHESPIFSVVREEQEHVFYKKSLPDLAHAVVGGHDQRRRHTRMSIPGYAKIVFNDRDSQSFSLEDLSPEGACLKGTPRVLPKDDLKIVIRVADRKNVRDFAIKAKILWRKGARMGIRFVELPQKIRDALKESVALHRTRLLNWSENARVSFPKNPRVLAAFIQTHFFLSDRSSKKDRMRQLLVKSLRRYQHHELWIVAARIALVDGKIELANEAISQAAKKAPMDPRVSALEEMKNALTRDSYIATQKKPEKLEILRRLFSR